MNDNNSNFVLKGPFAELTWFIKITYFLLKLNKSFSFSEDFSENYAPYFLTYELKRFFFKLKAIYQILILFYVYF